MLWIRCWSRQGKHLLAPNSTPSITLVLDPVSTFAYLDFYIFPLCGSSVLRSRSTFAAWHFINARFVDLRFLGTAFALMGTSSFRMSALLDEVMYTSASGIRPTP